MNIPSPNIPAKPRRHHKRRATSATTTPAAVTVLNVQAHTGLARVFFSDDVVDPPTDTSGYVIVIDGTPYNNGQVAEVGSVYVDLFFPDGDVVAGSAWSVSDGGGVTFAGGAALSVPESGTIVPE